MVLTKDIQKGLNRYFTSLKYTGYKSYTEVYKLLIFIFIDELLEGPMSHFITDKDYTEIDRALSQLYGTSLIPYKEFKEVLAEINAMASQYKSIEDNQLRGTDKGTLRV